MNEIFSVYKEQQYDVVLLCIDWVQVKMGLGSTGKPCCAWHQCMGGAWRGAWMGFVGIGPEHSNLNY